MEPFLLIANFKAQVTKNEIQTWFGTMKGTLGNTLIDNKDKLDTVVAAPFPYLDMVQRLGSEIGMSVGAQDISEFDQGAYTGEVTARMLLDYKVKYVFAGHSERRKYKGENASQVEAKVGKAISNGIVPVVGVSNLEEMPNNLRNYTPDQFVVMYEPWEAISSEGELHPVLPEKVIATESEWSRKMQVKLPFVYGGSIDSNYLDRLLTNYRPRGAAVGSKSIDPVAFFEIIQVVINKLAVKS